MFIANKYISEYDSRVASTRLPSVIDAWYLVFWRYAKGTQIYKTVSNYSFSGFGPYITKEVEIDFRLLAIDSLTDKSMIHIVPIIFESTDALAVVPLGEWFILFYKDRITAYSQVKKQQFRLKGSISNYKETIPIGIARTYHMFPEFERTHYSLAYCREDNIIHIDKSYKYELQVKPLTDVFDTKLRDELNSDEDTLTLGMFKDIDGKYIKIKRKDIKL